LIRSWVESHVDRYWNTVNRSVSKSGLAGELRNHWMEILYVFGIVFMTAGVVNAVIQPVNPGYIIYPSSGAQSATETFVDGFALLLGAAGIYLSYRSGRQTTKSKMVNFYLVLGLLLIATAVYIGIYVLGSK
jgi:hypothetical protein